MLIKIVSQNKTELEEFFKEALKDMVNISNSYMPGYPFILNLNIPAHQAIFKEFAHFIVEEIGELYTSIESGCSAESTVDECSDIIGFTMSLVNKTFMDLEISIEIPHGHIGIKHSAILNKLTTRAIVDLEMACNMLKNRPWKKQNYILDIKAFHKAFEKAIQSILILALTCSGSIANLKTGYYNKLNTNYKRINTHY